MANYKNCYDDSIRTTQYMFTVSHKLDPSLLALKRDIAKHNARVRKDARRIGKITDYYYPDMNKIKRVLLMARGPRRDDNGKILHFNADSCLQHQYATHFDVYVMIDRTNHAILEREIETGNTPGEMKRIDDLKMKIYAIETEGFKRKRVSDAFRR